MTNLIFSVILKPPTIVVQPPTSLIAPANLRLELRCVISGFPKPNTTWEQENGTEVTNSSRVISAINGSLIFRPLKESDTGFYTCQGENSRGSVTAKPTKLTVAGMCCIKLCFPRVESGSLDTILYSDPLLTPGKYTFRVKYLGYRLTTSR
jgi:hypothetical protein